MAFLCELAGVECPAGHFIRSMLGYLPPLVSLLGGQIKSQQQQQQNELRSHEKCMGHTKKKT